MRKNSLDYKTILNLYLAMPRHNRSIRGLHSQLQHKYEQKIKSKSISIPNINTIFNWSSKFRWQQIASEHDSKVSHQFNESIVNKQVNELDKMQSIITDLKQTSYLALQKITKALKSNVMQDIKSPQDIKSLTDAVSTSLKAYNLICGGATSRSESITHNLTSEKQIREQIMLLISSLSNEDGIQIKELESKDKDKLN